jgi:diguanylate cyclase (GGDEF)-like protein
MAVSQGDARLISARWTVALIALGVMALSMLAAAALAYATEAPPDWHYYALAAGAALIATPVWAMPLGRALHQLAEAHAELERSALTDMLTGLPNRRKFLAHASRVFAAEPGSAPQIVLLLIDIDGFTAINDSRGPDVGDRVLRVLADRIVQIVAASAAESDSMVARFGGDEFTVMLVAEDPEVGLSIADAVIYEAQRLITVPEGRVVSATVSIGIAAREDDEDVETVLRAADRSLEEAKRSRGNCWRRVRSAPMHDMAGLLPEIRGDLRPATGTF